MSDDADRRIAELESDVARLRRYVASLENERALLVEAANERIKEFDDMRKQLVERDVYEAQQILPPEQAALIKHLATVERCIEEGPVIYSYAESSECAFCDEWQTGAHLKGCAWVLMQFDRKPEATMTMVHEHALNEDARIKRERARYEGLRINRPTMDGHFHTMTGEALRRANEVVERSRAETIGNVRVYENPLVAPGRVYLMQNAAYMNPLEVTQAPDYAALENRVLNNMTSEERERIRKEGLMSEIALRLKVDELNGTNLFPRQQEFLGKFPSQLGDPLDLEATSEHPVAPNLGIGGDESEVAAPDDDKVP